ncbi:MAG: hypothetical protein IKO32_03030 [Lachnospiraceae bacterium]|nr:hypothetical protein [Lachnospiraceae bacterium]
MKKKILAVGISIILAASMLAGCNKGGIESQSDPKLIDLNPQGGSEIEAESWATGSDHVYSAESEKGGNVITFVFLEDEEAKDQIASSILYFEKLNERNIEYRMKKKGATKDDLKEFASNQCTAFNEGEVGELVNSMNRIQARFDEIGYTYPLTKPFFFAKTTMAEEGSEYLCYARDNCIYVSDAFYDSFDYQNEDDAEYFDYLILKELFHVLVLNSPEFKTNIDRIFSFTTCQEPTFTGDALEAIYRLPNAGDYDAYATFLVDGKEKNCIVLPYVPEFSDGASLLDNMEVGLVDIEDPSKIISLDNVTNFYLTMGNNTGYVNTIEDCAADNFAMAVCYQNTISYSTPSIINAILDYLKTGKDTEPVTGKGPEVTIILNE